MKHMVTNVECEVLVVGWGNAGSVAAITAHDEGADVLLIEKMPEGGGNCVFTAGSMCIPTSTEFAEYLDVIGFKTTEREIIDTFVRAAIHIPDFIRKLGGEVTPFAPLSGKIYPKVDLGPGFPVVPKGEHIVKLTITRETGGGEEYGGLRLWNLWKRNVESRKIRVMTSTHAKELVKNDRGEVTSVMAERDGESIFIKAKKAVIMTAGGYENNQAMLWEYYSAKPVKFLGSPHNTGDGIALLQKAGAALWHMTNMCCGLGFQAPEYEAAFPLACRWTDFIYMDKHGKRFMCETEWDIHDYGRAVSCFDANRIEYPAIPAYIIFGEQTRQGGALCSSSMGLNRDLYQWSSDNSAEIAKGWVIKADSITELAERISIDKSTLESTVARFNMGCKTGSDPEFGRAKEDMSAIEGPPYYAIQIWPALFCTQGGGRRDKESRVLDPDGKPIPRLYEAGELGSIFGWLYQGSIDLTAGIVCGQIAGRNAAKQERLDNS